MTSKERVKAAISFEPVDRLPTLWSILPGAIVRYGDALAEICRQYPDDFGTGGPDFRGWPNYELPPDYRVGEWTDIWGVTWRMAQDGIVGIPVTHPLADDEAFQTYQPPPRANPDEIRKQAEAIAASNPKHFVSAGGGNLFEVMQRLRGYDNLMMDLALDRPQAYRVRDLVKDYFLSFVREWCKYDCIDCIAYGDDWGTQRALIIHPDTWRRFFKPAYRELFAPAVEAGKAVHFHSDGFTWDIVVDWAEIGVTLYNPQHTIMGHQRWAQTYRGLMAIRTDLDRQHVLPHGTPAAVRGHVREVIECLGTAEGGLVLHGEVGPDVPLDNVRAMVEAFMEYGSRDYLDKLPPREETAGWALREKLGLA